MKTSQEKRRSRELREETKGVDYREKRGKKIDIRISKSRAEMLLMSVHLGEKKKGEEK